MISRAAFGFLVINVVAEIFCSGAIADHFYRCDPSEQAGYPISLEIHLNKQNNFVLAFDRNKAHQPNDRYGLLEMKNSERDWRRFVLQAVQNEGPFDKTEIFVPRLLPAIEQNFSVYWQVPNKGASHPLIELTCAGALIITELEASELYSLITADEMQHYITGAVDRLRGQCRTSYLHNTFRSRARALAIKSCVTTLLTVPSMIGGFFWGGALGIYIVTSLPTRSPLEPGPTWEVVLGMAVAGAISVGYLAEAFGDYAAGQKPLELKVIKDDRLLTHVNFENTFGKTYRDMYADAESYRRYLGFVRWMSSQKNIAMKLRENGEENWLVFVIVENG